MSDLQKDGGAAFPRPYFEHPTNGEWSSAQEGMTLRDWFAGQALAGYIANPDTAGSNSQTVARDCCRIADAFLAERALPPEVRL